MTRLAQQKSKRNPDRQIMLQERRARQRSDTSSRPHPAAYKLKIMGGQAYFVPRNKYILSGDKANVVSPCDVIWGEP